MHNIRLEQTARKSRFNVKGCGSPAKDQAAAQAGRYKNIKGQLKERGKQNV